MTRDRPDAPPPRDGDEGLEALLGQFRLETARTARLRSLVLAAILAAGVASSVVLYFGARARGRAAAVDFLPIAWVAGIGLGLAALELGVARLVTVRLTRDRPLPRGFWMLAAVVELSVPTVLVLLLARNAQDPALALSSPGTWLYFPFILLSTLFLDARTAAATGAIAALQYLGLAAFVVSTAPSEFSADPRLTLPAFHLQKSLLFLLTGAVAATVAHELRRRILRTFRGARERERILAMFGQLTAPAIVDRLLAERGEPASERIRVTVLFLDLRGFSTYAEQASPESVVRYLNTLFDWMIEVVHRHGGIVHQLLGDGFLAVFGAPLSRGTESADAIRAALEICDGVDELVQRAGLPATRVGIGLHAGEVVAGMVGSHIHKEYKVTGDVVNVAARIEQLCKTHDARLLCSGEVWDDAGEPLAEAHSLGPVEIRGRETPVELLRLR